ncbi:MAG: membrane protein insertase YidC [Microbacteriaceae bacterium]
MEFFGTLLWPIRWAIELILVAFHWVFTTLGMDSADGLTWVLSIVGLVLVVRAALIPLFVKQIRSQRSMLEVGPEMKKIQDKYKGKKDQFSREAMVRETQAMYKKHGTNPYAACLPMLVQIPIFFSLYSVLTTASQSGAGVGFLSQELANDFGQASFFGAPLHMALSGAIELGGPTAVFILAPIMVLLMTASQFITQKQIMSKNMSEAAKASPTYKTQKIMLYIIPFVFLFSGYAFPLGVMFYWLVSNIWTMCQQLIVINNMPTPGSPAYKAWEERQAKKAARKGILPVVVAEEVSDAPAQTQRVQPVGKNRAKKKGKK